MMIYAVLLYFGFVAKFEEGFHKFKMGGRGSVSIFLAKASLRSRFDSILHRFRRMLIGQGVEVIFY